MYIPIIVWLFGPLKLESCIFFLNFDFLQININLLFFFSFILMKDFCYKLCKLLCTYMIILVYVLSHYYYCSCASPRKKKNPKEIKLNYSFE